MRSAFFIMKIMKITNVDLIIRNGRDLSIPQGLKKKDLTSCGSRVMIFQNVPILIPTRIE